MTLRDRVSAAELLLKELPNRLHDPLVLAIPRSGFRIGQKLAELLNAEFDVALVGHLATPGKYSDRVGAVNEFGYLASEPQAEKESLSRGDLARLGSSRIEDLQKWRTLLTPLRAMKNPRGRDVILVDDGALSGCTFLAAAHAIRACKPLRLFIATAVAPKSLRSEMSVADRYIVLNEFDEVNSIDAHFEKAREIVTDEEMRTVLSDQPSL